MSWNCKKPSQISQQFSSILNWPTTTGVSVGFTGQQQKRKEKKEEKTGIIYSTHSCEYGSTGRSLCGTHPLILTDTATGWSADSKMQLPP